MGFLDFLFGKPRPSFGGGSGSSMADAVVITTTDSFAGVGHEYNYVELICGRRQVDWNLERQTLTQSPDGKPFDVLTVKLKDGTLRDFYFDISAFYGKF